MENNHQLGIIEEGLQLKLQIQAIQDQFLGIVNDFNELEEKDIHQQQQSTDLPPPAMEATRASGTKMSSGRARVRALYEARKARIRAKRAALCDLDRPTHKIKQKCRAKSPASSFDDEEEDKENMFNPLCGSTPLVGGPKPLIAGSKPFHGSQSHFMGGPRQTLQAPKQPVTAPLTQANLRNLPQVPERTLTWSIKKFLTPIKEEYQEQPAFGLPRLPSHVRPRQATPRAKQGCSKSDCRRRSAGEYVMLRADSRAQRKARPRSCGYYGTLPMDISEVRPAAPEHNQTLLADAAAGSVKPVTDLSKVLGDISQISHISSPHEQVSSANLIGAFHSTFNYPLHSTMNNPAGSHLNISDIKPVDEDMEDSDSVNQSSIVDTRTTVSEPISRSVLQRPSFASMQRSKDDSDMDYLQFNSPATRTSRASFSPSSYITPSKKPQAKLCKEHGLHPTFGGPCIFSNNNSTDNSVTLDDSCPELDVDENDNSQKVTTILHHTPETDCDSSYLSECVDDHHLSHDVDEYTAMYDSRSARMRMLKRQTGQAELKTVLRQPLGLCESDLNFDVSKKQMSLEATRSSLPDLSGLFTVTSIDVDDDDQSESTLHASSPRKTLIHDDFDGTLISDDPRPLCLSTNDEESPESNTGISVPVNSPNITDSTGSSSRPNTDQCEYSELGQQQVSTIQNNSSIIDHSISTKKSSLISCLPSRAQLAHKISKSHQRPFQLPEIKRKSSKRSSRHKTKRSASERAPSTDALSTGRTAVSCYSRSSRSRRSGPEWDSGCSVYSASRPRSRPRLVMTDNTGRQRAIRPESAPCPPPASLTHDRKKALAKKLKHFSNSFYKSTSTGNLDIETLAHF